MTSSPVCLDTSYLVGLFDESDLWHSQAMEIISLLRQHQVEVSYLDCVLNELFTVLGRRCRERGKAELFSILSDRISEAIPGTLITWVYPRLPGWYHRCLDLMRTTQGDLNFHDALIVVAIHELDFSALISFDAGFDRIPTVRRLHSPTGVEAWIAEQRL